MSSHDAQLVALCDAVDQVINAKKSSRYANTTEQEAYAKRTGGARVFTVKATDKGSEASISIAIQHDSASLLEDLYTALDAMIEVKEMDLRRDNPSVAISGQGVTFKFVVKA